MSRKLNENAGYTQPDLNKASGTVSGTWGYIPPIEQWKNLPAIPVVVEKDSEGNKWQLYFFSKKLDESTKTVSKKGGSLYSQQMSDIKRLMSLAENMNLTLEYGGKLDEANGVAVTKFEGDSATLLDEYEVKLETPEVDFKTCLLTCVDLVKNKAAGGGGLMSKFATKA